MKSAGFVVCCLFLTFSCGSVGLFSTLRVASEDKCLFGFEFCIFAEDNCLFGFKFCIGVWDGFLLHVCHLKMYYYQ